jgi:hypothetical protein
MAENDEMLSFAEFKKRLPGYSEPRIRAALLALGYKPVRPVENLRVTRYQVEWVADVRHWLQEHVG